MEGEGRDWARLRGTGSSLIFLAVESREGDSTAKLSRRRSGEGRETWHLSRPVGPGCPLQGIWHFLHQRAAAAAGPDAATCPWPPLSLSAKKGAAVLPLLSARGQQEGREGGQRP